MPYRTVIHWFRRDLRLTDNAGLNAAAKAAEQVVPAYILSDWSGAHSWTGSKRQAFLCASLESLAHNLETLGSKLVLRCGLADLQLEKLIKETQAEAVFFNRDYDPYGRDMEKKLQSLCSRLGIGCHGFKDRVLHEPEEVLTGSGSVYRVFTPYSRNWTSLPKDSPAGRVAGLGAAAKVHSLDLPNEKHWKIPANAADILPAGERAARKRMKEFIEGEGITEYAHGRNTPAGQTTSRLGQDLRFGLISIRELHARCMHAAARANAAGRASVETYVKELAWREFYFAILYHFPEVFEWEFNPEFRGLPWPGTEAHFAAWSQGRTGFPIVDAGMRQLLSTGFMHNRVRMIVSMFLTKDLHCDWRQGESFFMQHLVDGENASNNGGWQWSAGTGADAAPYFRIQNPWTQTKNYDAEGAYIKAWVPELKNVDAQRFWAPPKDGRPLAPGYPLPIVDHGMERERTLAIFAKHRQQQR